MTVHAGDDDRDRDERGEHDQRQRDAVEAERVVRVEARDPRQLLGELHRRRARIELRSSGSETSRVAIEASSAIQRPARNIALAEQQHHDARGDGQPDQNRQGQRAFY